MVVQGVKNPLVDLLSLEDKSLDEVRWTASCRNITFLLSSSSNTFCDKGLWSLHSGALNFQCKQDAKGEQQLCHYKEVQPPQCHGAGSRVTQRVKKMQIKIYPLIVFRFFIKSSIIIVSSSSIANTFTWPIFLGKLTKLVKRAVQMETQEILTCFSLL